MTQTDVEVIEEKKNMYPAYLYPTQAEKIVKKFGSITKAVESLLKKK